MSHSSSTLFEEEEANFDTEFHAPKEAIKDALESLEELNTLQGSVTASPDEASDTMEQDTSIAEDGDGDNDTRASHKEEEMITDSSSPANVLEDNAVEEAVRVNEGENEAIEDEPMEDEDASTADSTAANIVTTEDSNDMTGENLTAADATDNVADGNDSTMTRADARSDGEVGEGENSVSDVAADADIDDLDDKMADNDGEDAPVNSSAPASENGDTGIKDGEDAPVNSSAPASENGDTGIEQEVANLTSSRTSPATLSDSRPQTTSPTPSLISSAPSATSFNPAHSPSGSHASPAPPLSPPAESNSAADFTVDSDKKQKKPNRTPSRRSRGGPGEASPEVKALWTLPLSMGWKREIVIRSTQEGGRKNCDVYYFSPEGKKLRSSKEVERHLTLLRNEELAIENFTFYKDQVGEGPNEYVRQAGKTPSKLNVSTEIKAGKTPSNLNVSTENKPPSPAKKKKKKTTKEKKKTAKPTKKSPTKGISKSDIKSVDLTRESSPNHSNSPQPVRVLRVEKVIDANQQMSSNVIEIDGGEPDVSMVPPVPTGTTTIITINKASTPSPVVTVEKRAVAKKHTGKRTYKADTSVAELSRKKIRTDRSRSNSPLVINTDSQSGRTGMRLCGLECAGRVGIPPSLHCDTCMCLFHPECVGFLAGPHIKAFICKACQSTNRENGHLTSVGMMIANAQRPTVDKLAGKKSSSASINIAPVRPARLPMLVRAPGTGKLHPVSVTAASLLPQLQTQPRTVNLVTSRPATLTPRIPRAVTPSVAATLAAARPNLPPPQKLTFPDAETKTAITGQLLTLPPSLAQKVNLSRPMQIRVLDQKLTVPPNCFLSTAAGVKVILPPGALPGEMVHPGGSKPLSLTFQGEGDQHLQTLNVSALESRRPDEAISSTIQSSCGTQSVTQNKQASPKKKKVPTATLR